MDYAVFLRGINVNGHHVIKMAALREMVTSVGFQAVETYIQSGNVLLESADAPDDVRLRLEEALARQFGWPVGVAVHQAARLGEIARHCPFDVDPGTSVYVAFPLEPIGPDHLQAAATIPTETPDGDAWSLGEGVLYILYRRGLHLSKLAPTLFERRVGVPFTARNLRTVTKLAERVAGRLATKG